MQWPISGVNMLGITDKKETEHLRQCLKDIAEHAEKEGPFYSGSERESLIRYSKLTRPFTEYEARLIRQVLARIPREPEKEKPDPWMTKRVYKRAFYG